MSLYILGLHFGHDASVTVLKDGEPLVCLERERRVRRRHAIGLTVEDVEAALNTAGCTVKNIDYCAVTTTQSVEYIVRDPAQLTLSLDLQSGRIDSAHWAAGLTSADFEARSHRRVLDLVTKDPHHPYVWMMTADLRAANPANSVGAIEDFVSPPGWREGKTLRDIGQLILERPTDERMSQSMQLPIRLSLNECEIPGWMMSHHFAHAAYAFYTSGCERAAILTQDGSLPRGGYWNGMCYFGEGRSLYPMMPHHLNTGRLYERVSAFLGFSLEAGPGKMMGLAPYGKPAFFDPRFVGNTVDISTLMDEVPKASFPNWVPHPFDVHLNTWLHHCADRASSLGYDVAPLGDTSRILAPINVDIAASTQLWLEETMLRASREMRRAYEKKGIETGGNLCVSGGTALNCPANSRIHNDGSFSNVFVPPAVHDGGLSTGSALAVFHNTLKQDRTPLSGSAALAYLGVRHDAGETQKAFERHADVIHVSTIEDPHTRIAQRLAANDVVAVMTGPSEVGPRALGHRSILAHPGFADNWKRVNAIKKREQWRPFAPAVLESRAAEWFSGAPARSPFMLFTAKVLKPTIPAVTHVDGSARIQTVNDDSPELKAILTEFDRLTGFPIVLNTSLNGPGEPIAEDAADALQLLISSALDALFIDGFEITKI